MKTFSKLFFTLTMLLVLSSCGKEEEAAGFKFNANEFYGSWWQLTAEKTDGIDTYASNFTKDYYWAFSSAADKNVYFKTKGTDQFSNLDGNYIDAINNIMKFDGTAPFNAHTELNITSQSSTAITGWYTSEDGKKVEITITNRGAFTGIQKMDFNALTSGKWKITAQTTNGVDSYASLNDYMKSATWRFDGSRIYITLPIATETSGESYEITEDYNYATTGGSSIVSFGGSTKEVMFLSQTSTSFTMTNDFYRTTINTFTKQ